MTAARTALVTGAARGIGRRIAVNLAKDGYAVAVVDTDFDGYREFAADDETTSVIDELESHGAPVIAAEASTTDVDAMTNSGRASSTNGRRSARWSATQAADPGPSTATGPPRSTSTTSTTSCAETCTGPSPPSALRCPRYGAPPIPRSSPWVDHRGRSQIHRHLRHYGITKAAVMHYTRYLANDLAPEGIRVNCVAPGLIATGRAPAPAA